MLNQIIGYIVERQLIHSIWPQLWILNIFHTLSLSRLLVIRSSPSLSLKLAIGVSGVSTYGVEKLW